jgi:uncharacterized membrane protein
MDTFTVFAASYDALDAAEADFQTVREYYMVSGSLDTYDAAVITRDDAGKVGIVIKHEQPTRPGAWRELGIGLAGGALGALFPAIGTGAGLLGATGGAGLCALAGHVSAGLKRADLKDLGELLDEGHSGLVVVAASDVADRVEHFIRHASKLTRKSLKADETAVAKDIEAAADGPDRSYQHAVKQSEAAVREAEAEAEAAERAAAQYSTFRPRSGGDDLVRSLGDLARLRESGALSLEEFEAAKSKLLDG